MIRVEVLYAEGKEQVLYSLELEEGTSVADAIQLSGLLQAFPALKLEQCSVGIYARIVELQTPLQNGDRVEIYRSLIADPKEARRQRTKKT